MLQMCGVGNVKTEVLEGWNAKNHSFVFREFLFCVVKKHLESQFPGHNSNSNSNKK